MNLKLIYTTVPNEDVGKDLSRQLLDAKLIACANIFAPHTAIYEWEGKVCEEQEQVVILKTTDKHIDSLLEKLVEIHPYDTPCAIVLDPEKAHNDFAKWVEGQTS